MKNNKKLIPELRFPEFENEGEWEIKTLSGICDITNGKANAQDHVDNGRYPLFDRSEVIKASDEFIFDCEAVIIPGEGMRFIPKYYEGKFNLHQRAYALKDFSCSGQFVYYSMLHRSTLLSQKAVQSTVLSLRLPILQDFPIEIPKKPEEQEKIASCLSSLDEVISAHSQKLEQLKAHKKGLMQNLFPQQGKKVPKLRFKEFENEGEWQYEELGKISEIVRGGSPRPIQDFLTTNDDGLNWLKIADVPSDSKYITETKEKVIKEALNSTREVSPGDLILSNSMSFGRPYILKIKTCIHDGWIAIRKISNITFEDYLYYFISSESSQSYFQINAAGAAVKNLNAEIIKLLPIYLPKNKGEQQKISSCLSSLDELITAQAEKIEQLKLHKKGLMQGLFPKMND